jgi:hypothetical protein
VNSTEPVQRRRFLRVGLLGVLGLLGFRSPLFATSRTAVRSGHPEPRKGITAEKVVSTADLEGDEKLIRIFDGVRAIPEIVDGIGCRCGCAEQEGMYSLLSCYEVDSAMAKFCPVCQGEGALVARLHADGRTLDQIRKAIDARF